MEFTKHLHIYEKDPLMPALQKAGFKIEFAEYLNGSENGAVKETSLDRRELIALIAST